MMLEVIMNVAFWHLSNKEAKKLELDQSTHEGSGAAKRMCKTKYVTDATWSSETRKVLNRTQKYGSSSSLGRLSI